MRRLITLLLILPALAVGQSRFGHGGLTVSQMMPIINGAIGDSSKWTAGSHVHAIKPRGGKSVQADTIKAGYLNVTGDTQLDGNLTMNTIATEQVKLGTGSDAAPELSSAGDTNTGIRFPGSDVTTFVQGGSENVRINVGEMGIGTSTDNAGMTVGLTIDQGANDDEIMSFKSSDVAHGVTSSTETNTFGRILKYDAAGGGLLLAGYSDGTESGLALNAVCGSTPNPSVFKFTGFKKNGSSVAALSATERVLRIYNFTTTLFTLLGSGNIGQGTISPLATHSMVGSGGTGTGLHIVSSDVNKLRNTWAQATDTSSVTLRLDSVGDPRLFMTASDGDSARIHVRSDSTELYSKNALVLDAPVTLIGGSNVGVSKIDTVFTETFVPRWLKITSGAKSWYSPVYADTTGKW